MCVRGGCPGALVSDAPENYIVAVALYGPAHLRLMRLSAEVRQENP